MQRFPDARAVDVPGEIHLVESAAPPHQGEFRRSRRNPRRRSVLRLGLRLSRHLVTRPSALNARTVAHPSRRRRRNEKTERPHRRSRWRTLSARE